MKTNGGIMGIDGVKLQYINHNLREYIGTLSEQELLDLEKEIGEKYDNQNKVAIISEITREKKERILEKYISTTTADFLRTEFQNVLDDVNENKIIQSLQHYQNINVNADTLVKWCPIALDLEASYKIYDTLHAQGKKDSEIISVLTESYNKAREVEESLNAPNRSTVEEFNRFIQSAEDMLKQSKAGTESYDKYIKRMMNQNKEIMRKLA